MASLRRHRRLGRALLLVWALLAVLVAAPCAAAIDPSAACDHCASHACGQHDHGDGPCLHCDNPAVAVAQPDHQLPTAPATAAEVPATPVLIAAAPEPFLGAAPDPRPPAASPYLTTRRLRL